MAERHAPDAFSLMTGLLALGGAVLFLVADLSDVRVDGAVVASLLLVLFGAGGIVTVARKRSQGSLE